MLTSLLAPRQLFKFFSIIVINLLFIPSILATTKIETTHTDLDLNRQSLAPMLKNAIPAVVQITVEKVALTNPFKEKRPVGPQHKLPSGRSLAVGSGVILDANKGLIVTNAHVINQSRIIIVTLSNGRNYQAKAIGEDDGFDIGVIQIKAKHLNSLPVGDSDQLQVGDFVAAIGSPYGLNKSVTAGVISALNRDQPKIEGFQSFIQTDTPINPGNSGGALVNMKGELIGINTAIFTPMVGSIGIGFAIPSNMVKNVVEQLIKYGKVSRGMLGVIAQDLTPSLAEALNLKNDQGVMVTQVVPNTPAAQAGLQVTDIIEKLNDKPINSAQQLRNSLGITRPGTPIKLSITRHGTPQDITAKVGNPKKIQQQQAIPFLSGLRMRNFHELEADSNYVDGVQVTGIIEGSAAALAGLRPGDVITHANQQTITSTEELAKIAQSKTEHLLVQVMRGEESLFFVIESNQD